jgi:hypothetical protein
MRSFLPSLSSRRLWAALALPFALATASPALARNEPGDWEVGLHLGRTHFLDSDELENDTYLGASVGYCFTELFELGFAYDKIDTRSQDDDSEQDLDILTLDFIVNLGEDAHKPYVALGAGFVDRSIRGGGPASPADDRYGTIDLGIGYRGYLGKTFGIRLETRLFLTDDDGTGIGVGTADVRWSFGLAWSL